jgi:hypothetical protein
MIESEAFWLSTFLCEKQNNEYRHRMMIKIDCKKDKAEKRLV